MVLASFQVAATRPSSICTTFDLEQKGALTIQRTSCCSAVPITARCTGAGCESTELPHRVCSCGMPRVPRMARRRRLSSRNPFAKPPRSMREFKVCLREHTTTEAAGPRHLDPPSHPNADLFALTLDERAIRRTASFGTALRLIHALQPRLAADVKRDSPGASPAVAAETRRKQGCRGADGDGAARVLTRGYGRRAGESEFRYGCDERWLLAIWRPLVIAASSFC